MAGWLCLLQPRTASVKQHRLSSRALSVSQGAYSWQGFEGDADLVGRISGAAGVGAQGHEVDHLLVTPFGFRCLHFLAEFIAIGFTEERSVMLCS